jgi:ribosomal protein S18 acetylase RimI-like enzyme
MALKVYLSIHGCETILSSIKESLSNNKQEIVVVAGESGNLVGFLCVQIKKSFCYSNVTAEITEVFVNKKYRRRKHASKMIAFAEMYCIEHYTLHKLELLTGKENFEAQALYQTKGLYMLI